MKLIIGTKNSAKVEQMKGVLASVGIDVQGLPEDIDFPEVSEHYDTAQENARAKARTYSNILDAPVLSMDQALFIDGLEDDRQPGIHVRRIYGGDTRPSDEDILAYYQKLIGDLEDKVSGRWEYSVCVAHPDGSYDETVIISPRIFTRVKSDTIVPGYPLESIQIDPDTGRYISDMNLDEQANFWQRTIGRELINFVQHIDF